MRHSYKIKENTMDGLAVAQSSTVPDFWILMIKTLGGLCLVLGILMGVLYLLKHMTRPQRGPHSKGMISLVSSFYLAPRERLHLMDVMGRKILIGVTAQGITRIAEFEDLNCECGEQASEQPVAVTDSIFKNLMSRLTRETAPGNGSAAALHE
jgi:flagellar biosynthetic protein FliO